MAARRVFTQQDQDAFAAFSGDTNPMHMDKLAARRTQAGEPVVHGVHTLLWMLDSIAQDMPDLPTASAMKVRFVKMVYTGDRVERLITQRNEKQLRAIASVDGTEVVSLLVKFGAHGQSPQTSETPAITRPAAPLEKTIASVSGETGALPLIATPEAAERLFPHAARAFGVERVRALAATSYLVGMVTPGLHSIYGGLSFSLCTDTPAGRLDYAVSHADERFKIVNVDIVGGGISGSVEAFFRQPPIQQAAVATVAQRARPGAFAGSTALVVGGSRGLGELTAKYLAASGCHVIITYAVGKDEAEKVVSEIRAAGFQAEAVSYDALQDAAEQLAAVRDQVTHLYYFATPSIFRRKDGLFSADRFAEFNRFYIEAFAGLVEYVEANAGRKLGVFYPSSIAVEDRPAGMTEYAMSKIAGEMLCADLSTARPNVGITVHRLPRLPTDQTSSIVEVETLDPLDVMIPIIETVQDWR